MSTQSISCTHCLENFDSPTLLHQHIEKEHLKNDMVQIKSEKINEKVLISAPVCKNEKLLGPPLVCKKGKFWSSQYNEEIADDGNFRQTLNNHFTKDHAQIANEEYVQQSSTITKVSSDFDIPIKSETDFSYDQESTDGSSSIFLEQKPNIHSEVKIKTESLDLIKSEITVKKEELSTNEASKEFKRVKCKICSSKFNSEWELSEHMKNFKHKSLICQICSKQLSNYTTYRNHMKFHENPVKCSYCDKKLSTEFSKKLHEKTHVDVDPQFKCNICSAKFVYKQSLNRHLRKHSGEKPHKCRYCSSTFAEKYVLQNHELTHSGDRDTKCPHCPKMFTKIGIKRHVREVHLEIKPFKCDSCDKTFPSRSKLKIHEVVHQRPEKVCHLLCDICEKGYASYSSLVRHKRKTHEIIIGENIPMA